MELRIYSSQDGAQMNQAEAQLRARGLDEGEERVVEIIDNHFRTYRSTPVTADAIVNLIVSTPGLKWLSAAELEYNKVANQEELDRANQLVNWLATHGGKPEQLVNQGDEAFVNLRLLLLTLQGYPIDSTTISHATDRIIHNPGEKLFFVPKPRRTESKSAVARGDDSDSTNWLGDMVKNPDGSYRSKNVHEQKRDREAAEASKAQTTTRQAEPDAWGKLCNDLRNYGSSHSQRAAMNETYERGIANGKSLREIYGELNQLRKQYETTYSPIGASIRGDRSIR